MLSWFLSSAAPDAECSNIIVITCVLCILICYFILFFIDIIVFHYLLQHALLSLSPLSSLSLSFAAACFPLVVFSGAAMVLVSVDVGEGVGTDSSVHPSFIASHSLSFSISFSFIFILFCIIQSWIVCTCEWLPN